MLNKLSLSLNDKRIKLSVFLHNHFFCKLKRKKFVGWLNSAKPKYEYLNFFSNHERSVEIGDWEKRREELILTCYFTQKKDPQLGIIRLNPDIEYIRPWYDSIVKNKLNGIILHDGLNEEFIEQHENDFVQFRKVTYGNYSIFEERWFAYYQFIKLSQVQKVFLTDCNDVFITKNPFQMKLKENTLYIGRDCANKIYHSGWLEEERKRFEKDANFQFPKTYVYQNVYNAGVVGGTSKVVQAVAAEMINLTLKTKTEGHKDMTLINAIIHEHFPVHLDYHAGHKPLVNPTDDPFASGENLVSGYPLNSLFKGYEYDSDAYFIHK